MAKDTYYFEIDGKVYKAAMAFVKAVLVEVGNTDNQELRDLINESLNPKNHATKRSKWRKTADRLVTKFHREGRNVFKYYINSHVIALPRTLKGKIRDELDAPLDDSITDGPCDLCGEDSRMIDLATGDFDDAVRLCTAHLDEYMEDLDAAIARIRAERNLKPPSPTTSKHGKASQGQKDQEGERCKINELAGFLSSQGIKGKERNAIIKVRVNQGGFRDDLMKVYGRQCCMTGIRNEELLIASHIKPWSESSDEDKRKVANGLLLNALHDKAFDRGLITISKEKRVVVSSEVSESEKEMLEGMLFDEIKFPDDLENNQEFLDFLAWHRKCIFRE